MLIAETLDANSGSIQAMILARSTAEDIRQQAIKEGMVPLLGDGLAKVAAGYTTG